MDNWNPIMASHDEEISLQEAMQDPSRMMLFAIIFGFVMALGVVGHIESESVSVMQAMEDDARVSRGLCPKHNANRERLSYSMVMETYIEGAPKPHECYYADGSK